MKFRIALLSAFIVTLAVGAQAQKIGELPEDRRMRLLPDLAVKGVHRVKPGANQIVIVIVIANIGKGESEASHWNYSCS